MNTPTDFVSAALDAGQRGFPVFPLKPMGKAPLRKNWQRSATTDLDLIETTWHEVPLANVGIVTGHGLVVIDTDNMTADAALAEYDLPATTTVETSRGRHYYFKGNARNRAGILLDVDVRGDGGFVVGAGSLHASGARYRWHIPPWELGPQPIPTTLDELLKAGKGAEATLSDTSVLTARTLPPIIREGQRNTLLHKQAAAMHKVTGMSAEEMMPSMLAVNHARCQPPLPQEEVGKLVRSAIYGTAPWVWDPVEFAIDPRLTQRERLLLMALTQYADLEGLCWPGIRRLAQDTRMGKQTVVECIDGLVDAGRIAVERGSRGKSNRYRLL